MAKKPASQTKTFDMTEHERTYHGFMSLTKFSIIALIFVLVALYCFTVSVQPWLGLFFLVISVPAAFVINRMTAGSGH